MDGNDLSKLELSILKNLYRNRSSRKIAKAMNMDYGTVKEALLNLSSKGYVKYHVGILKNRYKLTEAGFDILTQKDASVRRSVISSTPLPEDKPIFKEYRPSDPPKSPEKKERKLIRKLKREG